MEARVIQIFWLLLRGVGAGVGGGAGAGEESDK